MDITPYLNNDSSNFIPIPDFENQHYVNNFKRIIPKPPDTIEPVLRKPINVSVNDNYEYLKRNYHRLVENPANLKKLSLPERRIVCELMEKSSNDYSRVYRLDIPNKNKHDNEGIDLENMLMLLSDESINRDFINSIKIYIQTHKVVKLTLYIRVGYIDPVYAENENELNRYATIECNIGQLTESDMDNIPQIIFNNLKPKIEEIYGIDHSGCVLHHIEGIDGEVCKVQFVGGSGHKECLPEILVNKKSIIDIENKDNKCFYWCCLLGLNYDKLKGKQDLHLTRTYTKMMNELQNIYDSMLVYPVIPTNSDHIKKIQLFEEMNKVFINVHGVDGNKVYPIFISKQSKEKKFKVINLLFYKQHYMYITKLGALYGAKNISNSYWLCDFCLTRIASHSKEKIEEHKKLSCQQKNILIRNFPAPNSIMKFQNYKHLQMHPIVIYYDVECYFDKIIHSVTETKTDAAKINKHILYSYCIFIDSNIPQFKSRMIIDKKENLNDNIEKRFVDNFLNIEKDIDKIYKEIEAIPVELKEEEVDYSAHDKKEFCDYCNLRFSESNPKVLHHDHFNGSFIATICNKCNILIQDTNMKIPVVAHNSKSYDHNFIVKWLAKYDNYKIEEDEESAEDMVDYFEEFNNLEKHKKVLKVLPKTDNKYLCIEFKRLKFIDSFSFLTGSLDNLVKDLKIEADKTNNYKYYFREVYEFYKDKFNEEIIGKICFRKGIYPYEYMDNIDKYKEDKIPDIECFDSELSGKKCSIDDYNFAKSVFEITNCRNMADYTLFYNSMDVLLLCCVFNNFRNIFFSKFKLDPCWYVSMPSLAWNIFLKESKIQLELISNEEIYNMIVKGIYGGISMIGSKRYAKSNNKYQYDYEPTKKSTYICYMDYNSLYPSTMASSKLPFGGFQICEEEEFLKIWDEILFRKKYYEEMSDEELQCEEYGYILEVDIDPPINKKLQKEYPPLPVRRVIELEEMSEIQIEWAKQLGLLNNDNTKMRCNTEKLISDLHPKKHYVIHYQNLKYICQRLGWNIMRIHKILKFKEKGYMKNFIEKMIKIRIEYKKNKQVAAANSIKLALNSIYGKSCENPENRANIKLVTTEEDFLKCTQNNWFKSFTVIDKDFRICRFKKYKTMCNKPCYIGMACLWLSKLKMVRIWYDYLQNLYGTSLKLLMTDTDSFIFKCETDDVYADIANNDEWLNKVDTGNLNVMPLLKRNLYFMNSGNTGALNLMKFEENDGVDLYSIKEFVGICIIF